MEQEWNCSQGGCPALESSFLFGLPQEVTREVMEHAVTLRMQKGQLLYTQDSPVEGIFCLKSGTVMTFVESFPGEILTLGYHKDGGTLGIASLYNARYLQSAKCVTACQVCFFSRRVMINLLSKNIKAHERMGEIRQGVIENLLEIIGDLHSKSIPQRLVGRLLYLRSVFGEDKDGFINIALIKDDIANLVGASVESVFRSISDLKQKGIIGMESRKIRILNESKLEQLARKISSN